MYLAPATILAFVPALLALPMEELEKRQWDYAQATVCTSSFFQGSCLTLSLRALGKTTCVNFNGDLISLNDKISSILVHNKGAVFTLWDDYGCNGAALCCIIAPGIQELSSFGFDNRASSISFEYEKA